MMFSAMHHERWPLICDRFIDDGEYIWFPYLLQNGLYRVKKGGTEAEYVASFRGQALCKGRLYESLTAAGDRIVFTPCGASEIAVYNRKNGEMLMLPFEQKVGARKTWCEKDSKFWESMLFGESVFMFGRGYPGILKFNVQTYEIEYITDWVNEVEKKVVPKSRQGYLFDGVRFGDRAFFSMNCADIILEFSFTDCKTKLHELHSGISGFKGMAGDGETLWLTPNYSDSIVKYDMKTNTCEIIDIAPYTANVGKTSSPYATPIVLNDRIILLPLCGEYILQIDRETLSVSVCKELQYLLNMKKIPNVGSGDGINAKFALNDHEIFFINGRDASWHRYCPKTGEGTQWFITANEERSKQICNIFLYGNKQWKWSEEKNHSLESYIHYVLNGYKSACEDASEMETYKPTGEGIYSYVVGKGVLHRELE